MNARDRRLHLFFPPEDLRWDVPASLVSDAHTIRKFRDLLRRARPIIDAMCQVCINTDCGDCYVWFSDCAAAGDAEARDYPIWTAARALVAEIDAALKESDAVEVPE